MNALYVICNGGYRTGSTAAYNVVRALFESKGLDFVHGLRSHPLEVEAEIDWHQQNPAWACTKSHVWVPTLGKCPPGLRVIYTCRNPYDAAGSLLSRGYEWSYIISEAQRQQFLTRYHLWSEVQRVHRPLVLSYEAFYEKDEMRVKAIAQHLGIPCPPKEITRIAKETGIAAVQRIQKDLNPGAQDEQTLIQADHIGANAGIPGEGAEILGPERCAVLAAALRATEYISIRAPDEK